MDYQPNARTTIGISANAIVNDGLVRSDSRAQSFDPDEKMTGHFNTLGNNDLHRRNYSVNGNFRRQLDTLGRELTADLDYARFGSWEYQNYQTSYLDLNNTPRVPIFACLATSAAIWISIPQRWITCILWPHWA